MERPRLVSLQGNGQAHGADYGQDAQPQMREGLQRPEIGGRGTPLERNVVTTEKCKPSLHQEKDTWQKSARMHKESAHYNKCFGWVTDRIKEC